MGKWNGRGRAHLIWEHIRTHSRIFFACCHLTLPTKSNPELSDHAPQRDTRDRQFKVDVQIIAFYPLDGIYCLNILIPVGKTPPFIGRAGFEELFKWALRLVEFQELEYGACLDQESGMVVEERTLHRNLSTHTDEISLHTVFSPFLQGAIPNCQTTHRRKTK